MAENIEKVAQPESSTSSVKVGVPQSGAVAKPKAASEAKTREVSTFTRFWRNAVGLPLSLIRRIIVIGSALYSAGCVALFLLPLFRPEGLAKVAPALRFLHAAIDPALALMNSIFSFDLEYMNYNFMLLVISFAVWLLQLGVAGRIEWLEGKIYKPLRTTDTTSADQIKSAAVIPQGTRMSLLRDYAASKQLLSQAKKDLAFLSIDVVSSTKMKIGEDQITIEHAFAEYKKFLERIFRDCRCWKVAWTPDGVMTCFLNADDAAAAGRRLLTELEWFNRDVHQLRSKFHVRCGMNVGEVMFPDEKSMEEISDEVIDVAGHMQKYADHDTMWVSGEAFKRLSDKTDFVRLEKQVDNRETFSWGPGRSTAK